MKPDVLLIQEPTGTMDHQHLSCRLRTSRCHSHRDRIILISWRLRGARRRPHSRCVMRGLRGSQPQVLVR